MPRRSGWLHEYVGSGKSNVTVGGIVVPLALLLFVALWPWVVAVAAGGALLVWAVGVVLEPGRQRREAAQRELDVAEYRRRHGPHAPLHLGSGRYPSYGQD